MASRIEAFSLNAIFDRAIAGGALFGAVLDGTWMHVGTPAGPFGSGKLFE